MDFLYRLIIVFFTLGILGQGQAFLGEGQPKSWYCQPCSHGSCYSSGYYYTKIHCFYFHWNGFNDDFQAV